MPSLIPPLFPPFERVNGQFGGPKKMEKVFNWAFSSSTISLSSLVISSFTLVYLSLHHIATLKMMTLERWGQVRRLGRKYWLFDCAVPHCHLVCHLARCFDILSLFYSAVQQWDIWCVWHSEHVTVKRSHWKNLIYVFCRSISGICMLLTLFVVKFQVKMCTTRTVMCTLHTMSVAQFIIDS